ncbi:hypothetical protein Micbo1qcDRAFT_174448 [Microdochium bolleyi]|uniref:Uncharacterized protein n=1 Tax=Microdochium bolleyi TaxID=196109 RepID=A0A136J8B4_9PEZI|nr:hypothetical protein Micbo1qcDRAFT_174448 [Microdochium bolleyi]
MQEIRYSQGGFCESFSKTTTDTKITIDSRENDPRRDESGSPHYATKISEGGSTDRIQDLLLMSTSEDEGPSSDEDYDPSKPVPADEVWTRRDRCPRVSRSIRLREGGGSQVHDDASLLVDDNSTSINAAQSTPQARIKRLTSLLTEEMESNAALRDELDATQKEVAEMRETIHCMKKEMADVEKYKAILTSTQSVTQETHRMLRSSRRRPARGGKLKAEIVVSSTARKRRMFAKFLFGGDYGHAVERILGKHLLEQTSWPADTHSPSIMHEGSPQITTHTPHHNVEVSSAHAHENQVLQQAHKSVSFLMPTISLPDSNKNMKSQTNVAAPATTAAQSDTIWPGARPEDDDAAYNDHEIRLRLRIDQLTGNLKHERDGNIALRDRLKAARAKISELETTKYQLLEEVEDLQRYKDTCMQLGFLGRSLYSLSRPKLDGYAKGNSLVASGSKVKHPHTGSHTMSKCRKELKSLACDPDSRHYIMKQRAAQSLLGLDDASGSSGRSKRQRPQRPRARPGDSHKLHWRVIRETSPSVTTQSELIGSNLNKDEPGSASYESLCIKNNNCAKSLKSDHKNMNGHSKREATNASVRIDALAATFPKINECDTNSQTGGDIGTFPAAQRRAHLLCTLIKEEIADNESLRSQIVELRTQNASLRRSNLHYQTLAADSEGYRKAAEQFQKAIAVLKQE